MWDLDLLSGHLKSVRLSEWISKKLEDKFMHWRFRVWPFHVRLKVVQFVMVSMVLYYLPSLQWFKKVSLNGIIVMAWLKKVLEMVSSWWAIETWTMSSRVTHKVHKVFICRVSTFLLGIIKLFSKLKLASQWQKTCIQFCPTLLWCLHMLQLACSQACDCAYTILNTTPSH